MGIDDKMNNQAQDAGGKMKSALGKATGDEQLQAEGQADQGSANIKQAGEKVKDAVRGVTDDK